MPTIADSTLLIHHVPTDGTPIGNGALRAVLGWDEARYNAAKNALLAEGKLTKGQGRGGTVRLVGLERLETAQAEAPSIRETPREKSVAKPTSLSANPTGLVFPAGLRRRGKIPMPKVWSSACGTPLMNCAPTAI